MEILYTFIIMLISLLPILLWAYIFSYFDNSENNRIRFFLWIWAWIFSVIPILYFWDLIDFLSFPFLNVFSYIHNISTFSSSLLFFLSILLFSSSLLFLSIFAWIAAFYKKIRFKKIMLLYLKNFIFFCLFLLLSSISIYILNYLFNLIPFFYLERENLWINFWEIAFSSLKLIIFYYILVWIIEELSKYLWFFSSSYIYINSVKTWVLYWVFVALWFSLAENILYLQNIFDVNWFSGKLVITYFFRSIFSVMLHVLCSFVVSYYFSKALIKYRGLNIKFPYIKTFFFWLFISILLHTFFDVALTFWLTFFIFLYFIWWYFYITNIFYKDND